MKVESTIITIIIIIIIINEGNSKREEEKTNKIDNTQISNNISTDKIIRQSKKER